MKKRQHRTTVTANEALTQLFTQWTTNAAMLAKEYPEDERLDALLEGLVRSFDSIMEGRSFGYNMTLLVMAQPRLWDEQYEEDVLNQE